MASFFYVLLMLFNQSSLPKQVDAQEDQPQRVK